MGISSFCTAQNLIVIFILWIACNVWYDFDYVSKEMGITFPHSSFRSTLWHHLQCLNQHTIFLTFIFFFNTFWAPFWHFDDPITVHIPTLRHISSPRILDLLCRFIFRLLEKGYLQTFNINGIKSQNYNVSRFALQLSLPNPMKPRC